MSAIALDHTSTPVTLDAGQEHSIFTHDGLGHVTVLFQGDGDGVFEMRIYVDGKLEEGFSTDESRIGTYSFRERFEIRVLNPASVGKTGTTSSFILRGVRVRPIRYHIP